MSRIVETVSPGKITLASVDGEREPWTIMEIVTYRRVPYWRSIPARLLRLARRRAEIESNYRRGWWRGLGDEWKDDPQDVIPLGGRQFIPRRAGSPLTPEDYDWPLAGNITDAIADHPAIVGLRVTDMRAGKPVIRVPCRTRPHSAYAAALEASEMPISGVPDRKGAIWL